MSKAHFFFFKDDLDRKYPNMAINLTSIEKISPDEEYFIKFNSGREMRLNISEKSFLNLLQKEGLILENLQDGTLHIIAPENITSENTFSFNTADNLAFEMKAKIGGEDQLEKVNLPLNQIDSMQTHPWWTTSHETSLSFFTDNDKFEDGLGDLVLPVSLQDLRAHMESLKNAEPVPSYRPAFGNMLKPEPFPEI